jgi:hypothetical protein
MLSRMSHEFARLSIQREIAKVEFQIDVVTGEGTLSEKKSN